MKKPPPVPPQNQSHKGTGDTKSDQPTRDAKPGVPENLSQQGRQGNIYQNTTNQGYQQDR